MIEDRLKEWGKEIRETKRKCSKQFSELKRLDSSEREWGLWREELKRRESIWLELTNVLIMEEVEWKQNARAKWTKEWDKNTKFFHGMTSYYRRVNYLEELEVMNRVVKGNKELRGGGEIMSHFKALYTENSS